tara:strand:- start:136 stop:300 length:165 start_codon:yes stop_codon:yes gene_type:complete
MEIKKKKLKKLSSNPSFEEKDHRLACGWSIEMEGSGQRKRYLRQLNKEEISTTN